MKKKPKPQIRRVPLTPEQQSELKFMRRYFAKELAAVFAREFLEAGENWDGYDDLADSLWSMADAMARRFVRGEGGTR